MTDQCPARVRNVVSGSTVKGLSVQASSWVGDAYFSAGPARRSTQATPRQLRAAVPPTVWTDREREMRELTALAGEPGPVCVVVVGPSEVGTSALAAQWIHEHASRYCDGQFFADLGGHGDPTPADVLSWWLLAMDVDIPDALPARAAAWRSATTEGRYAVLLDHAPDAAHVAPLLMASPASITLVTSHKPLPDLEQQGARHLQVGPLDDAHAAALLEKLAGPRAQHHLVGPCQGRPVRVRRVAAYLNLRDATTSSHHPTHQEVSTVSTDVLYHVLSPETKDLYRRIGAHVRTLDATTAQAMTSANQETTAALLDELVTASLLVEDSPVAGLPTRYLMPEDVYRDAAQRAADDTEELREAVRHRVTKDLQARLVEADFVLNPGSLRENREFAPYSDGTRTPNVDAKAASKFVTAELPAVLLLMRAAYRAGEMTTVCHLAEATWSGYVMNKFHEQFLVIQELAVAAARQADHPLLSKMLTRLAWPHLNLGHWQAATDAAKSARSAAVRVGDLGAESTAVSALGRVLRARGQYAQARRHFVESMLLAVEADDKRGAGLKARHVADCWLAEGEYRPAKEWYELALDTAQETAHDDKDRLNWARTAGKLADTLTALGSPQEALDYLRRAVEIMAVSASQSYHADVVAAQARAYQALEQVPDARQCYSDAEGLYRAAGDTDNAEFMRTQRENLTHDTN